MSTWQERLAEARTRAVFEPTPSGATPYVTTVERMCEQLDAVELTVAAAQSSPAVVAIGGAVALLLREAINARAYQAALRSRADTQPDRVDRLCDLLDVLIARMPEIPRA